MAKRIEFTVSQETWDRIEAARGHEPRASYVKRALAQALDGPSTTYVIDESLLRAAADPATPKALRFSAEEEAHHRAVERRMLARQLGVAPAYEDREPLKRVFDAHTAALERQRKLNEGKAGR